jgi:hypothetical protein
MAPHPLREKFPDRFGKRLCGSHIINLPAPLEATGKVTRDESDVLPMHVPARCPKCGLYTEYRILDAVDRAA